MRHVCPFEHLVAEVVTPWHHGGKGDRDQSASMFLIGVCDAGSRSQAAWLDEPPLDRQLNSNIPALEAVAHTQGNKLKTTLQCDDKTGVRLHNRTSARHWARVQCQGTKVVGGMPYTRVSDVHDTTSSCGALT
jgi:hypothetical protein